MARRANDGLMIYPGAQEKTGQSRFLVAVAMCSCVLGLSLASPAAAESPMNVDDAGTLDRGGFKLESVLRRDAGLRSAEVAVGFGIISGLEVELSGALGKDRDFSPSADTSGVGLGFKWVPVQQDSGWSL